MPLTLKNIASVNDVLAGAVLVVAHPDDEILWFSSILEQVAKIVIVFGAVRGEPGWSAGRKRVIEEYPYKNAVFLELNEPVSIFGANWANPETTGYGLQVSANSHTRHGFDADLYRTNYSKIVKQLKPILAGASAVFTHNPWGEYGHEDHVQVSRAVTAVAEKSGDIPVWYSNYVSDRSLRLMAKTMSRTGFRQAHLETRPDVVVALEKLYREAGCWTWSIEPYELPAADGFLQLISTVGKRRMRGAATLNFLTVDDGVQFHKKLSTLRRLGRWVARIYPNLRR